MQPTPQQQAVAQVYELMLDGNTETASSMAEEVLADCGEELARDARPETASAVVMAATAYAETLIKTGRARQAIAVIVNALSGAMPASPADSEVMTACVTLWHAVELLLTQTSPDSAVQRQAIETFCARLASLLYCVYYRVGRANPDNAALSDAYTTLKLLSNLVEIDRDCGCTPEVVAAIAASARNASLI